MKLWPASSRCCLSSRVRSPVRVVFSSVTSPVYKTARAESRRVVARRARWATTSAGRVTVKSKETRFVPWLRLTCCFPATVLSVRFSSRIVAVPAALASTSTFAVNSATSGEIFLTMICRFVHARVVPRLERNRTPDATGYKPRTPVPAVMIRSFARERRSLFALIVWRRELIVQLRHHRQNLVNRRTENDAQTCCRLLSAPVSRRLARCETCCRHSAPVVRSEKPARRCRDLRRQARHSRVRAFAA